MLHLRGQREPLYEVEQVVGGHAELEPDRIRLEAVARESRPYGVSGLRIARVTAVRLWPGQRNWGLGCVIEIPTSSTPAVSVTSRRRTSSRRGRSTE
jgi:hypothetical protein